MNPSSQITVAIVAVLHVVFALAELVLWERLTPLLKIYSPEQAKATSAVGRNMGIYNGIVAACLIWLISTPGLDLELARSLGTLLLICVVIAGIFGGLTIKWTIPVFQSLPALVALLAIWK